ncbi:hypothetical protein BCR44DRAFT_262917 [Catenaria anguillulae PL171]|uniref:Uncharacterized protein n=1 Tax=Catenaria anguillulae PL171 TaxID=765915 RepID=A0A1Y2HB82_9FUNG|nr:hypothetical protein BCR44DRAFT_262917 [Catenaria anguillulae PL171]
MHLGTLYFPHGTQCNKTFRRPRTVGICNLLPIELAQITLALAGPSPHVVQASLLVASSCSQPHSLHRGTWRNHIIFTLGVGCLKFRTDETISAPQHALSPTSRLIRFIQLFDHWLPVFPGRFDGSPKGPSTMSWLRMHTQLAPGWVWLSIPRVLCERNLVDRLSELNPKPE